MNSYAVTMGRAGGGSATFVVVVFALTPAMARRMASSQHPGFVAHAVRAVH